jgi:hypothetical protein
VYFVDPILLLKEQCHEIFCFWFLLQFPPSPRVFR